VHTPSRVASLTVEELSLVLHDIPRQDAIDELARRSLHPTRKRITHDFFARHVTLLLRLCDSPLSREGDVARRTIAQLVSCPPPQAPVWNAAHASAAITCSADALAMVFRMLPLSSMLRAAQCCVAWRHVRLLSHAWPHGGLSRYCHMLDSTYEDVRDDAFERLRSLIGDEHTRFPLPAIRSLLIKLLSFLESTSRRQDAFAVLLTITAHNHTAYTHVAVDVGFVMPLIRLLETDNTGCKDWIAKALQLLLHVSPLARNTFHANNGVVQLLQIDVGESCAAVVLEAVHLHQELFRHSMHVPMVCKGCVAWVEAVFTSTKTHSVMYKCVDALRTAYQMERVISLDVFRSWQTAMWRRAVDKNHVLSLMDTIAFHHTLTRAHAAIVLQVFSAHQHTDDLHLARKMCKITGNMACDASADVQQMIVELMLSALIQFSRHASEEDVQLEDGVALATEGTMALCALIRRTDSTLTNAILCEPRGDVSEVTELLCDRLLEESWTWHVLELIPRVLSCIPRTSHAAQHCLDAVRKLDAEGAFAEDIRMILSCV
jgi:hypothetical protein